MFIEGDGLLQAGEIAVEWDSRSVTFDQMPPPCQKAGVCQRPALRHQI